MNRLFSNEMETGSTFSKGERTSIDNTGISLALSQEFKREDLLWPQANRLREILGCVLSVNTSSGRMVDQCAK